jgi:hypothetical protein
VIMLLLNGHPHCWQQHDAHNQTHAEVLRTVK